MYNKCIEKRINVWMIVLIESTFNDLLIKQYLYNL